MADAVGSWISSGRQVFEELGVLSRFYTLFPVLMFLMQLIDVVCEPGCVWILDRESLASQCLHLPDFLRRWHRCLEIGIRVELVWLQVIFKEQFGTIDDLEVAAEVFDCLNGLLRGVSDFKRDRLLEGAEFIASSGKQLNTIVNLAEHAAINQVFHCDWLLCVDVSLLNMIG